MTWKDPVFDFAKIRSVLHHLCLDGLSRNKTSTSTSSGRGTIMTAVSASPDPSSIICYNCGKGGEYRSGCVVLAKAHGKSVSSPKRNRLVQGIARKAEVVHCAYDDHAHRLRVLRASSPTLTDEYAHGGRGEHPDPLR